MALLTHQKFQEMLVPDWVAVMAMQALLANPEITKNERLGPKEIESLADTAYEISSAMRRASDSSSLK
jgi:hypothetical protein